jgi:hypothetical protein
MRALLHGTPRENLDLIHAVTSNCACEFGLMGVRLRSCSAHLMLAEDQRALDGLLFGRRIVDRLREEEWLTREPVLGCAH